MAHTGNPLEDMIAHIAMRPQTRNDDLTTQQVVAGYRSQIADYQSEMAEMHSQMTALQTLLIIQEPEQGIL